MCVLTKYHTVQLSSFKVVFAHDTRQHKARIKCESNINILSNLATPKTTRRCVLFLSRVRTLTRDIDIAILSVRLSVRPSVRLSVRLSVRNTLVLYENG